MEIQLKTRATFLVSLSILCLSMMLVACKPSTNAPKEEKKAEDPNLVQLSAALQEKVQLVKVGQAEIREVLHIPGSIQVDEQRVARIGAPVTGRIAEIDAVLGQQVKHGQSLATLNSTELAQNQLVYIKALQQIDLQGKAVERARMLLDADVISKAEVQRRESELSAAQAELNAASNQLEVLGMSPQGIGKLTKSNQMHALSSVSARISGTVISRKINLGQVVQPADELFVVADLTRVYAVAEVPERQVDLIAVGQEVNIEVPALHQSTIKGKLIYVGDIVNPQTRTVTVRSEIDNRTKTLKPDMLVSMLVQSKPLPKLAIPVQGVVRENDKDHVFVQVAPNKYRLREVTLGSEYQNMVAVVNGLEAGEVVVSEGAFHVNNERKRKELE
jgi:cobalt-zinc-cadmium efflux system membrane fusion protein